MSNKQYTVLAVEDNKKEENGIYIYDLSSNSYRDESTSFVSLGFTEGADPETPRHVESVGNTLWTITRNRIVTLNYEKEEWKNDHISIEEIDESNLLFGDAQLRGHVTHLNEYHRGVFLTLYKSDSVLTNPESGKLYFSKSTELHSLDEISGITPTGKVHNANKYLAIPTLNKVTKIPKRDNLFEKLLEGSIDTDHYHPIEMPDNIMHIDSLDHLLLISDRSENFALQINEELFEYFNNPNDELMHDPFMTPGHENLLPMEASSIALAKEESKYYALFGTDMGKIIVYSIDNASGAHRHSTLEFLTMKQKVMEIGKDNRISGLKFDSGNVHFVLRNYKFAIPLYKLLSPNEWPQKSENLISNLNKVYSFNRILEAPHRISSWTELEVN
tara:strand:- start:25828 stop:26991 length:1164 start_codon:yes stop_codon:yes gene_type:complete